ncbi:MAG: RNA 3'-terminal phosphate cyclase, partial [Nitrosopumilus sp.]|nr:RNA 3'-terminal phosphate cyclase [Nitrosopumilus sp.]
RGGGEICLQVYPSHLKSISFTKRTTNNVKLICTFSKISEEKIKDQIEGIKRKLVDKNFVVEIKIKNQEAIDSGASLLIYSIDENSIIGIDTLFDKKIQRFDVEFGKFTNSLAVDDNLADMLVVPASLGSEKTTFQVREITKHLETNLFVTSKITGCKYGVRKINGGFEIIIKGISDSSIK